MNLKKCLLTENECYKRDTNITVKGLMLHSTGANNPYLKRYVQPNDGLLGNNTNGNHWNQYRPDGRQVCVHGFIGKLENGEIATYQTLPWNMKGWHAGGTANNNYIGVEICEDNLTDSNYFNKVYNEAVELFTYLCKEFNLNPLSDIICHSEGYKQGIASNHSDVMHWFSKHNKSMNTFRNDVQVLVNASVKPVQNIVAHVTVTAKDGLNIRTGIGTKNNIIAVAPYGGEYDVFEIKEGWGRINGGWFNLKYTTYNGNSKTTTYYKACSNSHTSLVNALNSIKVDSSYDNRKKIALANGIKDYKGSSTQNTSLLNKLKVGRLRKI